MRDLFRAEDQIGVRSGFCGLVAGEILEPGVTVLLFIRNFKERVYLKDHGT